MNETCVSPPLHAPIRCFFLIIFMPLFHFHPRTVPFLSKFFLGCLPCFVFVFFVFFGAINRRRTSPNDTNTYMHRVSQTVLRLQQIPTNHMKQAASPRGLFIKKKGREKKQKTEGNPHQFSSSLSGCLSSMPFAPS